MTIRGGAIDLALGGTNCKAVKCGGTLTVEDGAITVTAGGAQSKGISADGDAVFNGGSLHVDLAGDTVLDRVTNESSFVYTDASYATGVKGNNIVLNAGSFSMVISGIAGRGFSADNDLTIHGGTLAVTIPAWLPEVMNCLAPLST